MITTLALDQLTPESVARHGVVRLAAGRQLTPAELLDVARRLGRPEAFALPKYRPEGFPPEVTMIDSHGDGVTAAPRGFGQGWHQDSTYLANPPAFTLLHSYEVPDSGGDTMFADTRPALSALSDSDREALDRLVLEHSVRDSYRITAKDVGRGLDDLRRSLPAACHPAVFQHPRGGTTLCISPLYTRAALDAEIQPLFERVLRQVVKSRVVHKWEAAEILIWDNRVVLHAASSYNGEQRRRLIRTMAQDAGRTRP